MHSTPIWLTYNKSPYLAHFFQRVASTPSSNKATSQLAWNTGINHFIGLKEIRISEYLHPNSIIPSQKELYLVSHGLDHFLPIKRVWGNLILRFEFLNGVGDAFAYFISFFTLSSTCGSCPNDSCPCRMSYNTIAPRTWSGVLLLQLTYWSS